MKPVRVGLLGIGTVGAGTFHVLRRNREEITRRAGRHIEIAWVAARDLARAQAIVGPDIGVVADARAAVTDPDVDVIVEVIGGTTVAKDAILIAIAHGKHIVTANKALLATAGNEILSAASKHGVIGLTVQAAVDHGPENIRVNCVAPGGTQTEMIDKWAEGVPGVHDGLGRNPLGRPATPMEIAEAACWLLSDRASFVNGSTLVVDGGLLA